MYEAEKRDLVMEMSIEQRDKSEIMCRRQTFYLSDSELMGK